MHCPVCNHEDTKVVDSRLSGEGTAIRRRRECEACGHRFSTNEEVELLDLTVVKRDGNRQSYSREKMEHGLKKALEKRPVTESAFRNLVHGIERDIQRMKSNEITSSEIGEVVMNRLKAFDKVAYIRFASVYRQFEDEDSFQRELERLRSRSKKRKKHASRTRAAS
jgi:transcriptional repressor NrdR